MTSKTSRNPDRSQSTPRDSGATGGKMYVCFHAEQSVSEDAYVYTSLASEGGNP
jgi:hypothetical protein